MSTKFYPLMKVESDAKKLLSFGTSHFIMLVMIFAALFGASYIYTSKRAELADLRASASEALAKKADADNAAFQNVMRQEIGALKEQNMALASQVSALASSIAQRDAALATRKEEIKQLPPTELATQWGASAHEPAPVVSADGTFAAPMPLAQKSLTALEEVPVLQKDKGDLQQALSIQTQATRNSDAALGKEEQAHLSDVNTCKVDKQALKDEIDKVKKDAARDKRKWGVAGYILGALSVALKLI